MSTKAIERRQAQGPKGESRERRRNRIRNTAMGYLFLSPVILGMLLFTLGPILFSFFVSFTKFNNIAFEEWVWFDNYINMFRNDSFVKSIRFTVLFALASVPLGMVSSFFLAYVLNKPYKFMKVFRAIFYVPVIIPTVASTIIFRDIFAQRGVINDLLFRLGLPAYGFFDTPGTAFVSILLYSLWGAGGSMLLWLASFNSISAVYYEAAEIDGARELDKLFRITLPMATPMIFYNLIMAIISSLQSFSQIYMLTNGSPMGSTNTMVLIIYNYGIKYRESGIASAMAWFLFLIIFGLTMIVFKTNKWVYYEGGEGQ